MMPKSNLGLNQYRYDIIGFSRNCLGISPHKGQQDFLGEAFSFYKDGTLKYKYIDLAAANRYGKTVDLTIIQFFFSTYKHGLFIEGEDWFKYPYGIINLCPLVDLANVLRDMMNEVLMNRAKEQIKNPEGRGTCILGPMFMQGEKGDYLVTFGDYRGFKTKITNVNMEFRTTDDNAKAVQGTPKFLVTFDEAGRQKNFVNLMGAHVAPRTLDTGGIVVTATTPDVDTDSDYEEWWKKGDPQNYFRDPLHYSAYGSLYDNPHVTEDQIKKMISGIPDYLVPQVTLGQFIQRSDAFFHKPSIDKCFKNIDTEKLWIRQNKHDYVISADLAVAKAGDRSVIGVIDVTKIPFVLIRMVEPPKGTEHPELIQIMKKLLEYYNGEWKLPVSPVKLSCTAILVYDSTGLGGKMFQTELNTLFPRPRGFDFGGVTKKKFQILSSLRFILNKSYIEIPERFAGLKQELKDYTRADAGLETDGVMMLSLGAYMAERTIPMQLLAQNFVRMY